MPVATLGLADSQVAIEGKDVVLADLWTSCCAPAFTPVPQIVFRAGRVVLDAPGTHSANRLADIVERFRTIPAPHNEPARISTGGTP